MKTRNRHVLKALLSGAAVGCLVGTSAVAQIQMPAPNPHIGSPDFQLGVQLHRVQQSAEDRQFYMEIQSYLQVLGFYRGGIDGVWGLGSDRALGEFLDMAGQSEWSQETYDVLRAAAARYEQGGVSVREAIRNPANPDEEALEAAALQFQQGMEAYEAGDFATATRLFEAVLAVQQRVLGPEHWETFSARSNIAVGLLVQGRYADAESLQRELLEVQERVLGPEHPETFHTRGNLALSLSEQGRHIEAEALQREVLAYQLGALGPQHPETLRTLGNLALSLDRQDRFSEAEPILRDVLAARGRTLGQEHPNTLITLNNLAVNLSNQGRHAEAAQMQRGLLQVRERVQGRDHPDTLGTRMALIESLLRQDLFPATEVLQRDVLQYQLRTLGAEHPDTLRTRGNLAFNLSRQGRYSEADPILRDVLADQARILGLGHPDVFITLGYLAGSLWGQGQFAGALSVIEDNFTAIPAAVSSRGEIGLDLSIYLGWAWSAEELEPLDTASRTFPAQGYLTYGSLDVASGALAARAQAEEGVDVLRQFQDASEEVQRLRRAYLAAYEPTSTVTEMARERILQDMRAAQDTLAEVSARLARDFPALAEIEIPRALSAEEAQELLEPGEGLLAYTSTENHLYAWLISQDRVEWYRMDISAAELSERVARLREGLDQSVTPSAAIADGCAVSDAEGYWNSFDICAAQELHDLVLGQIDLDGIDELLVVPDGALETIPFSVLVSDIESDGTPQWLVERHAITTLPATSSLRALRLYSTAQELEVDSRRPFLGFAPVTFGGVSDESPLRGASIPDLPSTDDEVQLLSAFLGAGEEGVVLEDAATEHFVRTADLDQYRVLSFATHGFLSRETSEYTDGAINEMALALRPGQGQDGLLTSSEAATLRLNADWVLLSACNTAAGESGDDAEGLSGLARAFFYAGAETLLVSHWPIDDQATPTLLTDVMMRSQSDDISRAQSLRQAQLAMLGQPQYAHPFYWAPFSVVGDNR